MEVEALLAAGESRRSYLLVAVAVVVATGVRWRLLRPGLILQTYLILPAISWLRWSAVLSRWSDIPQSVSCSLLRPTPDMLTVHILVVDSLAVGILEVDILVVVLQTLDLDYNRIHRHYYSLLHSPSHHQNSTFLCQRV